MYHGRSDRVDSRVKKLVLQYTGKDDEFKKKTQKSKNIALARIKQAPYDTWVLKHDQLHSAYNC